MFHHNSVLIDPVIESNYLIEQIRNVILGEFNRRGAVIGISGGVDSATVLALTTKALGRERVIALAMPEKDSSKDSLHLAQKLTKHFGVKLIVEDLTNALTALGCYDFRDSAICHLFPDYDPVKDGIKLSLPNDLLGKGSLNVYTLVLVKKNGETQSKRVPSNIYLDIVAASNLKQRTRMMTLYRYAEKLKYAVVGTANKNEHAQGFFVKYGDGGADIQPIQHLYKTQVYQIAHYLGIPQEILERTPTSDTYSAESTQEEFYFRLPFSIMDRIWYGLEQNVPAEIVAKALELTVDQVKNVFRDLNQKKRTTNYLRAAPVTFSYKGESHEL